MNGESEVNGDKCIMEKIRSNPCTVTIPPSKTCTTGTRLQPFWVSVIKDDTTAGVLREGTVCNNVSWVVTEGTELVWTEAGGVAEAVAKRTVVLKAMVLGVARGALTAVGTLILWAIDTKMPCGVTLKTASLASRQGFWVQMGVTRCNSSGIRGGTSLMEGRMGVSRVI